MKNNKLYKINFFLVDFKSFSEFVYSNGLTKCASKLELWFDFVAKYSGNNLVQMYSSKP